MEHVRRQFSDLGRHRVWIGTGILLAIQAATAAVLRESGASESGILAASALAALGLFAIGAINVAHTPYPRWAYRGMVAILAAAVLITPATATSPEAWARQTRADLWLLPWFLVVLSFLPVPRTGRCAPNHRRVGWIMVGTAALMAVLVQFETRLRIF